MASIDTVFDQSFKKPCSLKIWFHTGHNYIWSSYSDADGGVFVPGYDAMYIWYVDTVGSSC